MKMTSERAQEYHDWLREKVREWQAEYERAMSAEVATGHIHTTRARADCYAHAMGKFVEFASEREAKQTETLHEMAKRLCISDKSCKYCPLRDVARGSRPCWDCTVRHLRINGESPESAIKSLRAWAAENPPKPKKTYREDFYEKFPDAPRTRDGFPGVLIGSIYTISEAMEAEYRDTMYPADWDKPLGYWEAE